MKVKDVTINLSEDQGNVSGIFQIPNQMKYLYVFAHGAGAGMDHPFMQKMANALSDKKIGTFRFQFPYMERGRRSPGSPKQAIAAMVAAVQKAKEEYPKMKLFAGGKSYGGRMASHAVAKNLVPELKGLVYLGFPLHAPGKPSIDRAAHLKDIKIPMLFLQGRKDKLATIDLMLPMIKKLPSSEIYIVDDGDHSFKVPKSSGKTIDEVIMDLATEISRWLKSL